MRDTIHGAKWWKFDFHAHTPASHDYGKGNQALKSISPREWLMNFMANEIDCVAITDHNTGGWIDQLKQELAKLEEEKPTGYRKLFLFPGVELSVHGGIHLLAIFDPSKGTQEISTLLGRVGYNGTFGETATCTNKSFVEVVEEVFKMGGIAIPAHVDKPCGLLLLQGVPNLGPTLKQNLQLDGLLAIELCDPTYKKPEIYNELKIQLSEVLGSDSHDLESVGRGFTWIKMESPNFDALRLSLHDGEDGVVRSDSGTKNPNDLSNRFYIKGITVSDGHKAGRGSPLVVNFSPWFTTLIGGRGSGKSSVLGYLRIALKQSKNLTGPLQKDFENFCQIYGREKSGMLTDKTEIKILVHKDKRDISLVWRSGVWKEFHCAENGELEDKGDPGDIDVRFPIRIYSQKQLFEMTKDPSVILQLVDSQVDKRKWLDNLHSLESQWMDLTRQYREVSSSLDSMSTYLKELDDVNIKIKVYEESGHRELLEKYSKSKSAVAEVDSSLTVLGKYAGEFSELVSRLPKVDLPDSLDASSILQMQQSLDRYKEICKAIRDASTNLAAVKRELSEAFQKTEWATKHVNIQAEYELLVKRLIEAGEKDPNGYEKLVKSKTDLEQKCKLRATHEESRKLLVGKMKDKLDEIKKHQKLLRELRMDVISKWNTGIVGKSIRIKLIPCGDIEGAESNLRMLIRKTGSEFAKDIYSPADEAGAEVGILSMLKVDGSKDATFDDVLKLRDNMIKELFSTESKVLSKRFISHILQMKQNNPDDIDKIRIWFPEDWISLSLVRGDKTEDIESGSAGQRTAAMLGLLLAMDGGPLIIDQPEDDLDTRLISDLVVNGIRKLKGAQQVVVVTHNPNIPVNGGAEHIVELKYQRGQIHAASAGGLQLASIRLAVCDIMEGGREALDRRYYRVAKALADVKTRSS
ncbi:MAG: TrlF family AAA-like ATPase [Bdellovibrio sp.]